MPQTPGTTIVNLQRIATRLKVGEVINPPEVMDAARRTMIGLDGNGNANPESVTGVTPLQRVGWFIPSWAVISSNAREEICLPQAAQAVRLVAYCKIAPASGPFIADLYSNGVFVDNVSIAVGETVSGPAILAATLPALARLHIAVTSHGNASDVSINLIVRPLLGATP